MIESNEKYPIEDWKYEVENGDTQRGYEDWLKTKLQQDRRENPSKRVKRAQRRPNKQSIVPNRV